MQKYLTPEETAEQLKVALSEIMALIDQGRLRALRIGENLRIPELELERLAETCAASPRASSGEALPGDSRWCLTRTGKKFRVAGSIAEGADIWPGQMRYPLKFPKSFMAALFKHFKTGVDVSIGGAFDGPPSGSLGEFIQHKLNTRMNPAVYVAALLIDEGYAIPSSRRGYIQFRDDHGSLDPAMKVFRSYANAR
jgi:excisionase family DNA binding protein